MINDDAASRKNPNPQGKGLVPLLRDWHSIQPALRGPKTPADFLRDYCLSSMVLAAEFRFKPVVGQRYFLYARENGWSLSLVAPHEWGERRVGQFVANCQLRTDMTWNLDASGMDPSSLAATRAQTFICAFVATLSSHPSITAHLPFYKATVPYYQRLLGTALASSLSASLPPGGDDMQALLQAQTSAPLLPAAARAPILLPAGSSC